MKMPVVFCLYTVHRPYCSLICVNLRAVSQTPEGAAVKLLPIRWLERGVAVAYCALRALIQYLLKHQSIDNANRLLYRVAQKWCLFLYALSS